MVEVKKGKSLHFLLAKVGLLLLLGLQISSPFQSAAQEPITWSINKGDNLPTNIIYKIIQDTLGQIWMATDNGICIYDGQSVKKLEIDSINDHFFAALHKDHLGRIWSLNLSGELFVSNMGKIEKVSKFASNKGKIESFAIWKNTLWISRKIDLYQYEVKCFKINDDKSISEIPNQTLNSTNVQFIKNPDKFYFVYKDKESKKYIINGIDDVTKSLKLFESEQFPLRILEVARDTFIVIDSKLDVSLNTKSGLEDKFTPKYRPNSIRKRGNQFYLLGQNGYQIIDQNKGKLSTSKRYFQHLNINDLFICKENLLWFCTSNQGIQIVNKPSNLFYPFKNANGQNGIITAVQKFNDEILIGTDEGKIYNIKEHSINFLADLKNKVYKIETSEDQFFVGTAVGIWSYKEGLLKKENSWGIKDLIYINENRFIHSSFLSITLSDLNKQLPGLKIKELGQRSYAIEKDKDNILWAGTIEGLYLFDLNKNQLINKNPIIGNHISDIIHLDNGESFVGTFANGVYYFKDKVLKERILPKMKKVIDLDGFGNNVAIANEEEIVIYNTESKQIQIVRSNDQLSNKLIRSILLEEKFLYVGTDDGLCKIDLISKSDNQELEISLKGFSHSNTTEPLNSEYILPPNTKNINIEFICISFKKNQEIRYKYRMTGLEEKWNTSSFNEVNYSSLPAGDYQFAVKAIDKNGNESNAKTIDITIKKSWHNYLITQIIFLLLFGGIIYWLTKAIADRNFRKEQEKVENQKRIDGMKMTALQNHMNPHFISNALYSIQDLIETDKNWEAGEYTSNFADLIRKSMRYATMERISFDQEITFLKIYLQLESIRNNNNVKSSIEISPELMANKKSIFLPPLLIQPIIENAFKHAFNDEIENPQITIKFEIEDHFLICRVIDNGIGFQDSNSGKNSKANNSTAISTVKERLILNAKQLEIENQEPRFEISSNSKNKVGTEIKLKIDFKYGKQ